MRKVGTLTVERPGAAVTAASHTGFLTLGIVLIGANLRAPITALGPVLPDIQTDLHLDGAQAGLLNALPLLTFGVLSLVAPGLGRRFGLERALGCALAALVVGSVVRSVALPGAIWGGTVLLSAGIAVGNVLLPGLVKRDFAERAAGRIGLYAAAMAGTAALASGLAVPIAHTLGLGWRWAIGIWALFACASLLVWLPQLTGQQHHLPSKGRAGGVAASPWRHPVGWQVSIFFVLQSLVFYSLIDWFGTYGATIGLSPETAGFALLVYQLVAIATNLGGAPLIRRFADQRPVGFVCGLLLLVGTVGLFLWPRFAIVWLIGGGFGAGLSMVTSLSLFALRTRDHHQASALSSMAQCIGYLGAAAGPFLVGVLHDASHGWGLPFMLLIASSALVMVFGTLAGRARFIETDLSRRAPSGTRGGQRMGSGSAAG